MPWLEWSRSGFRCLTFELPSEELKNLTEVMRDCGCAIRAVDGKWEATACRKEHDFVSLEVIEENADA